MPPVGDPQTNVRIAELNEIIRQAVEVDPRGHFVDTRGCLRQPGRDGRRRTDADGLPLRKNDMLHLCAQGAGALANAFTTAVERRHGHHRRPGLPHRVVAIGWSVRPGRAARVPRDRQLALTTSIVRAIPMPASTASAPSAVAR